jgi:hypothetical protein
MTDHELASTDDLSLASHVEATEPGRFRWDVPDHWQQGRGAFGGIVVAAMTRAAIASEADRERTVRAISCEILAPVLAGEARVHVETLRRGQGVTALDVRVMQTEDGASVLRARGTVTLARTRNHDRDLQITEPPVRPDYDTVSRAPVGPPFAPTFTQHLDFRPLGPAPFSGAEVPQVDGWIAAPRASSWGAPEVLALVDAYWPSLMVLETAPRPLVTLTFAAQLLAVPERGPLYHRGRALAAQDGYLAELRELFTADGRLVVANTQVITIVK